MSSAICFNLDESKNLSSGKGLKRLVRTNPDPNLDTVGPAQHLNLLPHNDTF